MKNKIKISIIINSLIVLLVALATIMMFTGFKFMDGDLVLESSKVSMFRFYTVDSNIFMGIVSLIFLIKEISFVKGKSNSISVGYYILKLIGTVGVTLTFLTTVLYLSRVVDGGLVVLLKNSNLFYHLIVPVLSMITFIFFEKTDKIKFKYTFLGTITMVMYSVFYVINILIHMENGTVALEYDWYYFVQNGILSIFIVLPIMLVFTYIISLGLWKCNKSGNIFKR